MHDLQTLVARNEQAARKCVSCNHFHCEYPGAERIVGAYRVRLSTRALPEGSAVTRPHGDMASASTADLCHRCVDLVGTRLRLAGGAILRVRLERVRDEQWDGSDVGESVAAFRNARRVTEIA